MKETEKIGPCPLSTEETLEINRRRTSIASFSQQHMQIIVVHTHTHLQKQEKPYTHFLIKTKEQQTPKETEMIRLNASMVTKETFPLKPRQTTEIIKNWSILLRKKRKLPSEAWMDKVHPPTTDTQ